MNILFSPHQDDETLFAAFTLMREKPLVVIVTSSHIQEDRGDGITDEQRCRETEAAMKLLGCAVYFAGIPDIALTQVYTEELMRGFKGFDNVYAPAVQGGNPQHDMVGAAARIVFPDVIQYTTYTKDELWTTGGTEVVPTKIELERKLKALQCYESQIHLSSTRPHFQAVAGKSEWYL